MGGPHVITRGLKQGKGKQKSQIQGDGIMRKTPLAIAGFENGRSHKAKNESSFWKLGKA